jgi:hypothetical protein
MRMNLPGDPDYDPTLPWVFKIKADGSVAPDVHVYVDDIRCTGRTEQEWWRASQRVFSVLTSLGLQDAARKRRISTLEGGVWAGSVIHLENPWKVREAEMTKWVAGSGALESWVGNVKGDPTRRTREGLGVPGAHGAHLPKFESILERGSSNDVFVDAGARRWWLENYEEGWEREEAVSGGTEKNEEEFTLEDPFLHDPMEDDMQWYELKVMSKEMRDILKGTRAHPKLVKPVPRLRSDIEALKRLTDFDAPPKRQIRMKERMRVMYGFGDASEKGFWSTIRMSNGDIVWKSWVWSRTMMEEHNSNFSELANLAHALEDLHKAGKMDGQEIFMLTDNTTACRGTTKNGKRLFDLVLQLRRIEMEGQCKIVLVHVAGRVSGRRECWSDEWRGNDDGRAPA